jgi:glycosyltransferase involved in cell wall biosynthesis
MAACKVAYLSPLYFDERSYLGGGERYPWNLARGVVEASRGTCAVELISFGEAPHRRVLAPGVGLRVLTASRRPRNPLDVLSWELPDAVAEVDLVHIHQAYTRCGEVGLLVAKQFGKPVCVTDHAGDSSPLGYRLGSLELADRIIAYSDFGASLYHTQTPIDIIKGGVDAALFTPPAHRPPRDRVIYVGRLLPHKGIDRLIAALPPELPLTICGRPYHEDYYCRLQALAQGKRVEFITGADDQTLRDLYARAWACVLPSVYQDCYGNAYLAPELMGFSLLEAMACGTPAIAARVAAMPEFIREGETGFVFDTLDQLADQLRALAHNPSLVERMGQRARRVIEEEFSLPVAGAKLWAVYQTLITPARGKAA